LGHEACEISCVEFTGKTQISLCCLNKLCIELALDFSGDNMPYMYHATSKANLSSIKAHGLAPAIKRPASIALGATQSKRQKSEEDQRWARFRYLLGKLVYKQYRLDQVLPHSGSAIKIEFSKKDFSVIDEIPYVDGHPEKIPGRHGAIAADKELEDILSEYANELELKGVHADVALENRQARSIELRKIKEISLSKYSDHFLFKLSYEFEKLTEDIEEAITRERLYFFNEDNFSKGYDSYVKHIASGDHTKIAILRVDAANVINPMFDTAQGNAATTKESIATNLISFKVDATVSDVVSKQAFSDNSPWQQLNAYVET
jgi:hypothetical protein